MMGIKVQQKKKKNFAKSFFPTHAVSPVIVQRQNTPTATLYIEPVKTMQTIMTTDQTEQQ